MIKYHVPLHVAKELKDLNFNMGCNAHFPVLASAGAVMHFSDVPAKSIETAWNSLPDGMAAPIWDQVREWLRDVHKIHIDVSPLNELSSNGWELIPTGEYHGSTVSMGYKQKALFVNINDDYATYTGRDYFVTLSETIYRTLKFIKADISDSKK